MTATLAETEPLALLGGPKAVPDSLEEKDLFKWPIVTAEDEEAILQVLHAGAMSGTDITRAFEEEFAEWIGTKHALGYCNGTASLHAALWACGVGAGDEVICPSITYWASCTPVLSLGGTVNFADIDRNTLCIDPDDIEHRIGPRTKVIIVVHYVGHPSDMDRILPIARKHGIKVLEDVSHAQGGVYRGKKVGTFGDIAAMSMMAGKSFATGEAGMVVTDDGDLYDRCIAYGHYERTGSPNLYDPADPPRLEDGLERYKGIALGGYKHRMNQMCSAMGRVQLKYYDERITEIQKAMNRFWDLLEGTPGIVPLRPPKDSGSTMGGWYAARGIYREEELGGLPLARFCQAVTAEGVPCGAGANYPLHLHPAFHSADIFNQGRPTVLAFGQRDVRQKPGSLPVSENVNKFVFRIPWFKKDYPEIIECYAKAYRKAALRAEELLEEEASD